MTRINGNLHPKYLIDQHLVAEYREIVRVPNHVYKHGIKSPIPELFTLGTGHVTFFFDKIEFLHNRFNSIVAEMKDRDITVNMSDDSFKRLKKTSYYNSCQIHYSVPIVVERIRERVMTMKREPTLRGVPINRKLYCSILNLSL